ncbi:MAG: Do family serine endopeptidase [Bacteroidales bacterium]
MKGKRIVATAAIALFSAFVALFVYTRFFEKPVVVGDRGSVMEMPAQFTANRVMAEGPVDFSEVAERVVHGVVHVKTITIQQFSARNPILEYFYGDSYGGSGSREVPGFGSGVIISPDGYIITNNHVIEDANEVEVTLNDNRTFKAEIVGRDPSTDIALLKVDAKGLAYLTYGDSDKLRLGQWVLAIGNPFNLTSTVTAGIVSAKGRSLGLLEDQYRIESFIQTDAALNRGNSGGALVNTDGELVGITSAILSPSGTYAGNSFAIPVSIVSKVVADLKEYGEVQRAIIGVNIRDITSYDAKEYNLDQVRGVLIIGVTDNGAAEEAGIKEGDIILKVDDRNTNTSAELQELIGKKRPGDKAKVVVLRKGNEKTFDVVLRNLAGTTEIVKVGESGGMIFGVNFQSLTQNDRSKFGISKGMRVETVAEGRLNDLGIRKGDIITQINGKDVNSLSDIKDATRNGSELKSIFGIQSNGTEFRYIFR